MRDLATIRDDVHRIRTAIAGTVTPPEPTPPVTPPVVTTAAFRDIQCNVQQTDPYVEASAHVRWVLGQGVVVGWNELGTPQLQALIDNSPGWAHYSGPTKDSAAVTISWRDDIFELVESGYERENRGWAHITPARYILWVLLRHRATGKLYWRINTHVVHHIEVSGLPRIIGAITGQNARAKHHFARLGYRTQILAAQHPVLGGGDLNVDYLAEKALPPSKRCTWFPYTVLSAVATVLNPNHGTHGGRCIDWTWIAGTGITLAGEPYVLPHQSSDHNPVRRSVRLT